MKGTATNLLSFAIALYYVAFSTGLVQQQDHRQNRDDKPRLAPLTQASSLSKAPTSVSTSRRSFGIISTASLSSLLIGGGSSGFSARADPLNAFIPVGSRVLQQAATLKRAEGWISPQLVTEIGISRIGSCATALATSRSLGPLQQPVSPFASKELYYPPSFAGDWEVKATLQQKIFPFGPDFVLSRSLVDGSPRNRGEQLGDSTSYVVRYLPSSNGEPRAIADRRFNLVSMSRSYQQLSPVISDSIQWDSQKDPTRLSYRTESITADMRPIGPRKAEVYLTARRTEEMTSSEQQMVFATAERGRTVTVGTGSVTADDNEIITEFHKIDEDTIQATSRIAVYLVPNPNSREGVLWQQVNGKAVAFYDYDFVMERKKENPAPSPIEQTMELTKETPESSPIEQTIERPISTSDETTEKTEV